MNSRELPLPKLRWFQFRLRTLLVTVTLCAVVCSWFAVKRQQAERQRRIVAAITEAGGKVGHYYRTVATVANTPKPPAPEWLVDLLGIDFFSDVEAVTLPEVGAADLVPHLAGLRGLTQVRVTGDDGRYGCVAMGAAIGKSRLGDHGLEHLKGLSELRILQLDMTAVTDSGLKNLKAVTNLEQLDLLGTRVGDAGLRSLAELPQLQELHLDLTQVSDHGLVSIAGLTNLRILSLWMTNVTDAGLDSLMGMSLLTELGLLGTAVTDSGLKRLGTLTNLEALNLGYTQVTDAGLKHLEALPKLRTLHISNTQVSEKGVKELQKALPNCQITY